MGISEKIQRIIKKILKYISRMFSKTPKRKFYFGMFYKHCKVKDNVNKYLKKLTEQWEELPPHFVSSSEKKTGRQEILDYIDSINRSLKA